MLLDSRLQKGFDIYLGLIDGTAPDSATTPDAFNILLATRKVLKIPCQRSATQQAHSCRIHVDDTFVTLSNIIQATRTMADLYIRWVMWLNNASVISGNALLAG